MPSRDSRSPTTTRPEPQGRVQAGPGRRDQSDPAYAEDDDSLKDRKSSARRSWNGSSRSSNRSNDRRPAESSGPGRSPCPRRPGPSSRSRSPTRSGSNWLGCSRRWRPRSPAADGSRASRSTSRWRSWATCANRDLNELCLAVAAAVEPFGRFDLSVEGLGAFPSPGAAAGRLGGDHGRRSRPASATSGKAVVRAATQAGYRPDDLRFHPHVTLGRIKTDAGGPAT